MNEIETEIAQGTTVRSVERALDILECFSSDENELTLGEISDKIRLPKATVFRLLSTLIARGYIIQNENQRYMLGFKLFALSDVVRTNITIRDIALPFMRKLNEQTGETIDLNILDQYERICIEKIESKHTLRNFIRIGERNTLIYGASGKLLLAFQDGAYLQETLSYYKVNDRNFIAKLTEDIAKVKEQKFAFTIGERVEGGFAIAAPLYDYTGKVEACITMAGPVFRLTGNESRFIEKVVSAGKEISKQLGYIEK